ncbi:MAG: hypothetical protein HZB61_01245 [Nitrospirae bacterium]|nr:hypothetical protein [Nitrospirota bacterium]
MITNRMVIRFKDKSLLKGSSFDFSPDKTFFHLSLLSGEKVRVDIEKLKAAFFVKTFDGNKNYTYKYKDMIPWGGNKLKVEFADGEVMVGYAKFYPFGRPAFLLTPADLKGNNQRVLVVISATKNIVFL